MALESVDIFGNLQPASGKIFPNNTLEIIPYFFKYKTGATSVFQINSQGTSVTNIELPPESYQSLSEFYSPTELLKSGYIQVGNKYIKSYKKFDRSFEFFKNYFTETYTPKSGGTPKINAYVDLEKYPVALILGDKLPCLAEYNKIEFGTLGSLQLTFRKYFNVQAFNSPTLKKSEEYEKELNRAVSSIIINITDRIDKIKSKVSAGSLDKKSIPSCFLPDPDPALSGPPTQTISGVTNKAPVVDNPNIKLPTQEVKGLDANAAQQAASKAQSTASNAVSQAQNAVGGLTSQAQGAVSQAQGTLEGAAGQAQGALGNVQQSAGGVLSNLSSGVKGALGGGALGAGIGALAGGGKGALIGAGTGVLAGGIAGKIVDKLNPKGIKPDGLGKDWSPDKFSPEAIAGNDKFVNPKTGTIGSTSELAKGLKSVTGGIGNVVSGVTKAASSVVSGVTGAVGGALGNIPVVGAAAGSIVSGAGAIAGGTISGAGAIAGGAISGVGSGVGSTVGGALAGAGIGAGVGAIVSGAKGAGIGAAAGGAVGAAAAKLASVQKGLPKPNIPKPPNTPRIKTVKIPRPDNTKGVQTLLNLPKSPLG